MSSTHFDSRQITQFIFLVYYIVVFSKKFHCIFDISSNTQIYYLVTYFNFVCFAGLKKSEISKWTMRWGLHISWILRGIVFQEFWLVRGAVVSHGRCHEVGLSLNGDSLFEGPLPRKKRIWLASWDFWPST